MALLILVYKVLHPGLDMLIKTHEEGVTCTEVGETVTALRFSLTMRLQKEDGMSKPEQECSEKHEMEPAWVVRLYRVSMWLSPVRFFITFIIERNRWFKTSEISLIIPKGQRQFISFPNGTMEGYHPHPSTNLQHLPKTSFQPAPSFSRDKAPLETNSTRKVRLLC
ncbi:hypothetical protein BD779DRAFT_106176 [Infundibulicybe gibba]|nr:hypothetical protein BD779DRAFT_106176 [Infundibulicybe gibba]